MHHGRNEAPVMNVAGKDVNQWDASIHFENGTRAMPDGHQLQWPNWEAPAPASFYHRGNNNGEIFDVSGKSVDAHDQTIHLSGGERAFPDGTKIESSKHRVKDKASLS